MEIYIINVKDSLLKNCINNINNVIRCNFQAEEEDEETTTKTHYKIKRTHSYFINLVLFRIRVKQNREYEKLYRKNKQKSHYFMLNSSAVNEFSDDKFKALYMDKMKAFRRYR